MSLRNLAAKIMIAGIPGPALDPDARRIVGDWKVGGVILFRRNVQSPEQCFELIAQLRALRTEPLLMCVDQEGGRVQRLRAPMTLFPTMRELGQSGDLALAREVGRQLAREMGAVGFDLDFAPVVDVDTNPANPVIGDRSFARTPDEVSRYACALIEGMQSEGMLACAKHFPGHGDTVEDSHLALPSLPHGIERLRQVEWPPFAATTRAGVATVMTAHVMFPALDPKNPATMSKVCLDILRTELGFLGAIISDDLEMKAIADRYDIADAAVQAVAAGCDTLLICHTPERIAKSIEKLASEAERSPAFRARLEEAAHRTSKLKPMSHTATYVPPPAPTGVLAQFLAKGVARAHKDPTELTA